MLTKDVSAELEQALQKIDTQGKQPTVALVKAHLSSNVPMTAIIAAIKSWKGNGQIPKVEVAADSNADINQKIAALEHQVAMLTERLNALEDKQ